MSEWLHSPQAWSSRPLDDRLRLLRKHYCTGPCGQSNSVLATRAATDAALKEAIRAVRERDEARRKVDALASLIGRLAGKAMNAVCDCIRRPMGVEPDSATDVMRFINEIIDRCGDADPDWAEMADGDGDGDAP